MKAIFLDIDGVICTGGIHINPDCLQNLVSLVNDTEAKIIVTSTWRLIPPSLKHLEETLAKHNLKVFRCTPSLPDLGRPAEIMHFVKPFKMQGMTHWVILDDHDVTKQLLEKDKTAETEKDITDHFVQTNLREGLTKEKVVEAFAILNSPIN